MKRALLGGVLILGTFGTVTSYGQDVSTRHLLLRGPNTTAANLGSVQVPTLTAPQTYIFPNYGGTIGVFVTPLSINSGVRTNNLGQLETVPMMAGQLLIGSNTGAPQAATLTGTTNQVIVANGDGAITLSLPQDIHTGATPTFAGATLNGLLDVTTGGATILGTTSINASGTAATNIGNTTGGSVTISVNSGTTDLILQGIASTTTATEFLTLDGTNVRARALTSFLIANNGITYNDGGDGAFRLGGNAAGEAPFTENRFLSLAAFDLTIGGTPGDYIVIDGGATDGSVNVNSFGTGEIRLTSSNGITLDASSGAGAQNINILATSPGGQLGLSSNGQMTLNSGASDIVISVTSAGSIVDIDANGAGSSVDIDAAGSTNINTAISSGNVTVGNTTNTVALQGGTNTITGTTDINTTGNATTTIGSLTNTGGINLRADADIVIDVVDALPGTPNHLVLNNIVVESPITDLLWITASNQVRRAAFSSTANEGVIFESGSYRLGASNTTDVPLASTRYINTDGNSLILSETGTDFVEFNGSTQTVGIGKLADPEYRLDVDYSMTAGGSPEGAIRARSTNANGTPNAAIAVRATSVTDGSFAYGVEASATYNGTTVGLDPNRAVSGVFGSADNGGQDIIAIGGQFDASAGTNEGGNIGVFATGSNSTTGLNIGAAVGTDGLSIGLALLNTLNATYDNVGLVSVSANGNSLGAYIESSDEGLRVEASQVGIVVGELNSTPVSGIEIAATSVGLLVGLGAGTPNTGISVDANNVGIDVVDAPVSYSGDGSTVFGDDDADTHEFQGVFEVNTGASSATAQIGNGSGGSITLLADNNITLNPGNAAGNVILENIDVSATPDNILTLTAANEVRQKAFSGLADQGISWDAGAGEFVLGGPTDGDNAITTDRFVNIDASGSLAFTTDGPNGLSVEIDGATRQLVGTKTTAVSGSILEANLTANGNGNSSRAIHATVTGTAFGLAGLSSTITYTGTGTANAGLGPYAIGTRGTVNTTSGTIKNYGVMGEAIGTNSGVNVGAYTLAYGGGRKSVGVIGVSGSSASDVDAQTALAGTGTLPDGTTIGVFGFNNLSGTNDYGIVGVGRTLLQGNTFINTTGTGTTTIGNTTTGGPVEILSSGTNRILIRSASINGQIDLDAVNTIASGVLQVGDGSPGDAVVVNSAGGPNIVLDETGLTRAGSMVINPGTGNLVSTDGRLTVAELTTLNGGASIGNDDADPITLRGVVNINTTNTGALATNIGTSAFANTITVGSSTASNTTNLNSPVITAPNLPGGANTDNLVTITGAGAVRSTSVATALGSTAWLVGGNSLGAAGTVGTNDANGFSIETNNTTRLTFDGTSANATAAVNVVPDADNTRDLGSDALRWQDVYVNGTSLHIGPTGGQAANTELAIGYSANTARFFVNNVEEFTLSGTTATFNTDVTATGNLQAQGGFVTVGSGGNALSITNTNITQLGGLPMVIDLAGNQLQIQGGLRVNASTILGDGGVADFVTVNTDASLENLIIAETGISRSGANIAINPGATFDLTTNGGITSAENITISSGGLTVTAGGVTILSGSLEADGDAQLGDANTDAVTINGAAQFNAGVRVPINVAAGPFVADASTYVVIQPTPSDVTLPAGSNGRLIIVKNTSGGNINVNGAGGDTFEGGDAVNIQANGTSVQYIFQGGTWYQIGN